MRRQLILLILTLLVGADVHEIDVILFNPTIDPGSLFSQFQTYYVRRYILRDTPKSLPEIYPLYVETSRPDLHGLHTTITREDPSKGFRVIKTIQLTAAVLPLWAQTSTVDAPGSVAIVALLDLMQIPIMVNGTAHDRLFLNVPVTKEPSQAQYHISVPVPSGMHRLIFLGFPAAGSQEAIGTTYLADELQIDARNGGTPLKRQVSTPRP